MSVALRMADPSADLPTLRHLLSRVLREGTEFVQRRGDEALGPACLAYFADWGRPEDRAFIAETHPGDRLAGGAWIRRPLSGGIPFLGVAVEPELRGHGLGTALVRACQRSALDHGHDLSLTVHCRSPAIVLYRRCGFREVGLREEPSTGPMVRMVWSDVRPSSRGSRRDPAL